MKHKGLFFVLLFLLFFAPIMMLISRAFFPNNYLFSSLYKLIFLFPVFYRFYFRKKSVKESFSEGFSFRIFKERWLGAAGIGLGLGCVYLSAYLLFKGFIDVSRITSGLDGLASITASNIIFIGLYVIIFNSLFEEFFWRGFLFKELNVMVNPYVAHIFTGIAFSFHHIMFYYNWFSVPFLVAATVGLVGYAIIMNFVFLRYKDLYSCWLVHAIVDCVQIGIGLSVLGLL